MGMIGSRVQYRARNGNRKTGVIIKYFELTGAIVVQNDNDNSLWRGWKDELTFLDEKAA